MSLYTEYGEFIDHLVNALYIKPITVESSYGPTVNMFMHWLEEQQGRTTFRGVTAEDALKWCGSKEVSKATVGKYRKGLKHLFKWLYLKDMISAEEIMKLEMFKPPRSEAKPPPKAFTDDELQQIFERINALWPYHVVSVERYVRGEKCDVLKLRTSLTGLQQRMIVWTMLETGLRLCEIHQLSIDDVDPINEYIPVIGKNGKYREVPYSDMLKVEMRRWLAHRDLVISGRNRVAGAEPVDLFGTMVLPTGDEHHRLWIVLEHPRDPKRIGQPVAYKTMADWINRINGRGQRGRKNGAKKDIDANWHKFRKTFATKCWQAGMDIGIISKVIGHAATSTTSIYLDIDRITVMKEAKVFEGDRRNLYDGLDPGLNIRKPADEERDEQEVSETTADQVGDGSGLGSDDTQIGAPAPA